MKKLLAAASIAALVAGAAFAVDVASMIQIDGDALNLATSDDGATFKGVMAKAYDPSGSSDYLWKLSASGDNAGAEIWSWSDSAAVSSATIWMAPTDWLKVKVGDLDCASIANPQFGWWAKSAESSGYGYEADLAFGNLSATVSLQPGKSAYWIDSSAEGFDKIGGFWVDAKYSLGDWGTVQAVVARKTALVAHKADALADSALAFGVAYQNMGYMATGYYADVFLSLEDGGDGLVFQGVTSQIGGQWISDFGLKIQETNVITYAKGYSDLAYSNSDVLFGFEVKATYDLGAVVTPYVQIDGYNVMDAWKYPWSTAPDATNLNVQLGMDTAIGGCSINAHVEIPVDFDNYKFGFSVPVEFTLNL